MQNVYTGTNFVEYLKCIIDVLMMGGKFLYYDRTTCTSRIDWTKMTRDTLTLTTIRRNVIYLSCNNYSN